MSREQAYRDAEALKKHIEGVGVPCSIELRSGRGADPWASIRKSLRMHHHTASWYKGPKGNLTPTLYLCKNGRPEDNLPGPLCNGYGGYDGIYRIICMGEANHSGRGGPITIDGVHVPRDSARKPTWGTEWEGGYQDWEDINIPRYPDGMLEFMGRVDVALAHWSGRPLTSQLEHSTWTSRKIDRKNFTREKGIALTTKWSKASPEPGPEPEPTLEDDDMNFIIKGDKSAEWWLSDHKTKRWLQDRDEVANIIWHTVASGGKIGCTKDNGPLVYKQDYVDRIVTIDTDMGPQQDRIELRATDVQVRLTELTEAVEAFTPA